MQFDYYIVLACRAVLCVGKILWSLWIERAKERENLKRLIRKRQQLKCIYEEEFTIEIVCNLWHCIALNFSVWKKSNCFDLTRKRRVLNVHFWGWVNSEQWHCLFGELEFEKMFLMESMDRVPFWTCRPHKHSIIKSLLTKCVLFGIFLYGRKFVIKNFLRTKEIW